MALDKQIVVRVTAELLDALKADADANGRTVSHHVRYLLELEMRLRENVRTPYGAREVRGIECETSAEARLEEARRSAEKMFNPHGRLASATPTLSQRYKQSASPYTSPPAKPYEPFT